MRNAIDCLSDFVDDNLKAFRILPWVLGGIGAFIIIKRANVFHQFRRASSIPIGLIKENKVLSGRVVTCNSDSLGVWHIPMGQKLLKWKVTPPGLNNHDDGLIRVKFSGVALHSNKDVQDWLEKNLLNQSISFMLLHYDTQDDAIESIVYTKKKGIFSGKYDVNQAIISTGNGSLLDEVKGFKTVEAYAKFVTQMSKKEITAQRRGLGVWKGTIHVSWWRRIYSMIKKQ